MTLVRRTSPPGEFVSLVRPRSWAVGSFDGYSFPVDVTDGPDSLLIEASLPGFKPEDVAGESTTETARAGA